jgi:hypothetical protein
MPRLLLLLTALLLAPQLAGCLPVLETCTIESDPYTVWDMPAFCEQPCFVDGDGDGHGSEPAAEDLWDEAACLAAGHAILGGDCDDTDPRRFLGAVEVCDGVDNDCMNPEAVEAGAEVRPLGEEPIEGADPGTFVCSPPDGAPVQLFILSGSTVAGVHVNPEGIIHVEEGDRVGGVLRIGALVPQGVAGPIAVGAAASWEVDRMVGFEPLTSDLRVGSTELEPWYLEAELDLSGLTIPSGAEEGEGRYLVLAGGMAPDASWPVSLTDPWYCYETPPIGPGTEPCPPVWSHDMPADAFDDHDLADMDALDLAACVEAGQARLPTITQAFDDDEQPCTIRPDGRDCFPLYETRAMGCAFLQIVLGPPNSGSAR